MSKSGQAVIDKTAKRLAKLTLDYWATLPKKEADQHYKNFKTTVLRYRRFVLMSNNSKESRKINDIECSTKAEDFESTSSPIYPGWPPAKPSKRGYEWPQVGQHCPTIRDQESDH